LSLTTSEPGETTPRPVISAKKAYDPGCFGSNDGAIAITAIGGLSPYVYSVDSTNWTGNSVITGLTAGVYTVYVKELSLGRVTRGPEIVLSNPAQLKARITINKTVSKLGVADGEITVTAVDGTAPYRYAIDGQNSYQYVGKFTNLPARPYTFHVRDGRGCMASANALLAEEGKISLSAEVTKPVSCDNREAQITVTALGGREPYQYRLDDGPWGVAATLVDVTSGAHTVEVKDAIGNTGALAVFVSAPKKLEVTARVAILPTTGTSMDGAILIVTSGGSGNYTYELTNVGTYTSPSIGGLGASIYPITVTDNSSGCTATTIFKLSTVDVIVNKTVINLYKSHKSEVYTIRLSDVPTGEVTVVIEDPNRVVTLSPATVTFTFQNWNVAQEVEATISSHIKSPVGGLTYYTTKIRNAVTPGAPADYAGIVREVIVNVTDDGTLDCVDFENQVPEITLNGQPVNSEREMSVCNSNWNVLSASIEGGVRYDWWLDGQFPEVSTDSSFQLTQSGFYAVTAWKDDHCKVVSEPLLVNVMNVPDIPFIVGRRIAMEGEEVAYKVQSPSAGLTYNWMIPDVGYRLANGYSLTDTEIKMVIGHSSSALRVMAADVNNICAGVEGRLNIEVRIACTVGVYPTVINSTSNRQLKIVPKNMQVNSIAFINTVGESYPYMAHGSFPLKSGEEMYIDVKGLPTGHYFIVFYGQEQSGPDVYEGKNVKVTEHIVVKN
jgi:hypothetical protein